MFFAVLFICPFVAYGAETCSAGQMMVDGACIEPEFTITTTEMSAGATFSFKMSASGVFYVDFDDGNGVQKIDRTNNTTNTTYTSAAYSTAGTHTIKMYGDATGYTTSSRVAAISFRDNKNIKTVDGSLGAIFGGNTPDMFYYTFSGCTSLESIPADLFSGVTGSANRMFDNTFDTCTSLTSIPENLFAGVTGSANSMFNSTFYGCTSLQSIPVGLFSGVTGSSDYMFSQTFYGCTSLESIPENLFSGVTGSGKSMFSGTFSGCTSLQSIPADLFSGVTGSSDNMFYYTFYGCTSLASLPDGLFKNIEGKPASSMFYETFRNCTNLSGYIPADTFAKMDSTDFNSATMRSIFSNTALDTSCPAGTHQYITGFESAWGGKVACETISCTDDEMLIDGACVEPEFTITTTDMAAGTVFEFSISASGVFYVDFDDGRGVQKIEKTNTTYTTYASAAYSTAGTHTIKMYGDVTAYNTSNNIAAISFKNNTNIKSVDGSMGAIFGGSTKHMFSDTFYGCTKLESIPETLFSGVSGSANRMFSSTFRGCTSLQSIPENLFSGVSGSANSMFNGTFRGCTSLKSLPNGLFKNIEGRPATSAFNSTFGYCSNLSGYIPSDMFEKLDSTDFDPATMSGIFTYTVLDKQCPAGMYQYITGFESAWDGKVSCVPCPDGMCSINKPCSPTANATGKRTCHYNANTGDYSDCDGCWFVSCNDGYQYINGECKIAITCNPGQYLPAGASECAPCPAGRYCIGNTTYIYTPHYDQGISGYCDSGSYSPAGASECTECPFVTDPYGGLAEAYSSDGDFDSIDTCVATYEYMPEYMVEMLGITVQDAIDMFGYNPDSDANKRGFFAARCHYDTVTQQYTKDCAGFISMCEGGYYTNVEINEELGAPYLEASTLEEMLNTYCVPAEPGYWSPGLPHTDLENITQEEASLTWVRNACPAGTTSAAGASDISQCVGGRTLHIGDDITMNLTTTRPETPRVMVFQVLDELYYGGLSDTEKTINKNTDKKFRIFFDNKDYWLHDYTVE